jgi:hypothetical protein
MDVASVIDVSYSPYTPSSRSAVTFGLWTAAAGRGRLTSHRFYFLDVKMYRDYAVAKQSNLKAQEGVAIIMRGAAFR